MTDSLEDIDGIFGDSETPITNALIQRVMKAHPGVSARAQADYYEAVHQELAPLAREFERKISLLEKQLEEEKKARAFNANQCVQLQNEIFAQAKILRNGINTINEQERTIHELTSKLKEPSA